MTLLLEITIFFERQEDPMAKLLEVVAMCKKQVGDMIVTHLDYHKDSDELHVKVYQA